MEFVGDVQHFTSFGFFVFIVLVMGVFGPLCSASGVCVARRDGVMCYIFLRVVYESRSLASDTRPCLPIYVFIARLAVTPFIPFDSSLVLCWRWASSSPFLPPSVPLPHHSPSLCPMPLDYPCSP